MCSFIKYSKFNYLNCTATTIERGYMKKKNFFSAVMLSVILLSSCGGDRDSSSEKSSMLPSDETSLSTSDKPSLSDELKSFQGVTFTNQTITYDGTSHSLEVEGAPSDALITY